MKKETNWFVERVLPGIVLATIFGLLTVYVNVVGLKESTREYLESTTRYRGDVDKKRIILPICCLTIMIALLY